MEREKYVDESWKETAAREKEQLDNITRQGAGAPKKAGLHAHDEEEPSQESEPAAPPEAEAATQQEAVPSAITFLDYVASLGYQTMIFLGGIPHPVSNKLEKNLQQAKLLIDTLVMLREKTEGNLSGQESDLLNGSIYELQMKYVEISSGKAPA